MRNIQQNQQTKQRQWGWSVATYGEADTSMMQTDALRVLFGLVPVEMMEEGGGQHIMSFVRLQEENYFQISGSGVTFLWFNFFIFVSFLELGFTSRTAHFLVST